MEGDNHIVLFRRAYCFSLLKYLGLKQQKEVNANFNFVYKTFFCGFDDVIYQHFKKKTLNEKNI